MSLLKRIILLVSIVISFLQVQGADKYTDENRPYEFGFSIAGEQHRHEKKDENGIIMGEFGFITADGVYHVTVYATDENGNFKIISMKNIRVKPYPGTSSSTSTGTATGFEKGRSLSYSSQQNDQTPPSSYNTEKQKPNINGEKLAPKPESFPAKSCSHCSLPTTTSKIPIQTNRAYSSSNQGTGSGNFNSNATPNTRYNQNIQNRVPLNSYQQPIYDTSTLEQYNNPNSAPINNQNAQNSELLNSNRQSNFQNNVGANNLNKNLQPPNLGQYSNKNVGPAYNNNQQSIQSNSKPRFGDTNSQFPITGSQNEYNIENSGKHNSPSILNERNPKQIGINNQNQIGLDQQYDNYGQSPAGKIQKPQLISAQMQIVDKNTDVYYKKPGEKEGLPNGLTKGDMEQLLYTFNYTVGFHGHFEEGYSSGAKQGYYYVTGRNGVRTRVDYVADKNGFRPKISQEVLDLLSDEVPKPEIEKDDKYGLKGYEFKWLYYPVGSRR